VRIEFKNTRSCGEDPGQGMLKIKVKSIRNKRQQKKMIKKYLETGDLFYKSRIFPLVCTVRQKPMARTGNILPEDSAAVRLSM